MKEKGQLSLELEEEKMKDEEKGEKFLKIEFYEEKNFKETEIGPIPEDWEVVRLGEVCDIKSGGTPSRNIKRFWENGKIPWIRSEQCDDCFIYGAKEFITEDGLINSSAKVFKVGTVLVAMVGATIGKTGYLMLSAATNQNVAGLYPVDENRLSSLFLFYSLQSKYNDFYENGGYRIANLRFIRSFSIPLPPLSEQKAIAEVLSTIQSVREKTEEVIKATKELKKSMMKHLFTYGPVPMDQVDKVKLKETEIGPIPEHWEVVRLGEVVLDKISGDWGIGENKEGFEKCFVLRGTDFEKCENNIYNTIPLRYIRKNSIKKRRLNIGDILIELSGGGPDQPTGRVFLVSDNLLKYLGNNVLFSNFVKKLVLQKDVVIPYYFYRYWQYLYFRGRTLIYEKRTTGIRNFKYNEFLENEKIPLPPLSEQQKISEILQAIDEKIQKEEEKKKALDNLFKSMLSYLMSGKIRIKILEGD